MLANIEFDLKQEAEAFGRPRTGGSTGDVSEREYGLDDEEFKVISKQMKAIAEKQREERLKEPKDG